MSGDATLPRVAVCRRLVVALYLLVLLAGLLPAPIGPQAASTGFDRDAASLVRPAHDGGTVAWRSVPGGAGGEADRGAVPDAAPCHLACHCACQVAVLPDAAARRTSPPVRPAAFSAAPSHALRPGLLAPPSEPPRT